MDVTTPDQLLALAWAGKRREKLRLLFAFDEALGRAVTQAREPMMGQIRLAWWRDQLAADRKNVKEYEMLAGVLHEAGLAQKLGDMVNGWEHLLDDLPLPPESLASYALGRGGTLFAVAAELYGVKESPGLVRSGMNWALADFAFRCRDTVTSARALAQITRITEIEGLPLSLGVLTVLAQADVTRGEHRWRPGSPRRTLRALLYAVLRR